MKQDEIIEMARQAGFMMENSAAIQAAEIFAKLVAAKALAQPEQEPVADDFFRMIADKNPKPFPLPQRTWTTLTEEELHEICNSLDYYGDRGLVQLIESKLKEKNNA